MQMAFFMLINDLSVEVSDTTGDATKYQLLVTKKFYYQLLKRNPTT